MTLVEYIALLEHPDIIKREQTEALNDIIESYPFFQSARAIQLKGLKKTGSFKYNSALRTTAVHTTDRNVLFEFITTTNYTPSQISNLRVAAEEIVTEKKETAPDLENHKKPSESHLQQKKDTNGNQFSEETKETSFSPDFDLSGTIESKKTPKSFRESPEAPIESLDFDLPKRVIITEDEKNSFLPQSETEATILLDPDLYHRKETNSTKENLPIKKSHPTALAKTEEKSIDLSAASDLELEAPSENNEKASETYTEETSKKATAAEDTLELGKPLDFKPNEMHSFSEWLQLTQITPIKRDTPLSKQEDKTETDNSTENKSLKIEEKLALIDRFIDTNPKIVPKRENIPNENLAKQQKFQKSELMTETLAKVYVEQQQYKKAIQAYKILSLKYPEKSSFFADRIKAIKQLQQNK